MARFTETTVFHRRASRHHLPLSFDPQDSSPNLWPSPSPRPVSGQVPSTVASRLTNSLLKEVTKSVSNLSSFPTFLQPLHPIKLPTVLLTELTPLLPDNHNDTPMVQPLFFPAPVSPHPNLDILPILPHLLRVFVGLTRMLRWVDHWTWTSPLMQSILRSLTPTGPSGKRQL